MPTSFLICYPDVPASSLVISTNPTYDVDYSIENSLYGKRHNYAQLAATSLSVIITYDLGAGNSRTVDHFIVGGVSQVLANNIDTITLEGSNNGSTWSNQLGTATLATRTFDGPDDDDLIFTSSYNDTLAGTLAAYRYFRVKIGSGFTFPPNKMAVSKLFFGAAFDMGLEPSTYDMQVVVDQDSDTWVYDRGQTLMTKAFHPRHRFTVEWDGVSDDKATEFKEKVLNNPYREYMYLYTKTFLDPLYDNKLIYCKVVDAECSVTKEVKDWNVIKAVFEESI
ncbi:MAG: hypothetical protein E6R03_09710 [Hyphomicrobiaceae bacterium]|nr:MAG: hypothetical protein E6R03_09710 [Hyphomicrobiaceae bacterium]